MSNNRFLDLEGLTKYTDLVKNYIDVKIDEVSDTFNTSIENKVDKETFENRFEYILHESLLPENRNPWTAYLVGDEMEVLYLTIEALEDDLMVSFSDNTIQYSIDNCQTWNELPPDTATPAINAGDTISFKATGQPQDPDNPVGPEPAAYTMGTTSFNTFGLVPDSYRGIGTFTVNKNFNLKGNVMSMLFGDEGKNSFDLTGYDSAFARLFRGCSTLQSVSKDFLPATTLTTKCYYYMFQGCTSLVTAPELPATTLADSCYISMFEGCTSLVSVPELPATTLARLCYDQMFQGCTSLVTAPELPATTLAEHCYQYMFNSCVNLTNAPALPAATLTDYCYSGMFCSCTSLVTAPELPATTLAEDCYEYMFQYCESLTTAPELPATTLTNYCYSYMFEGCSSLVVAPELPATTLTNYCYSYMFEGCSSLVVAPELPATTLTERCYFGMFADCTSLVTAPELPATTLAPECYSEMFNYCESLTTTPSILPATTLVDWCYAYMFYGCTSLVTAPELPATVLVDSCYNSMFVDCSSLNYIKMLATDISPRGCLTYWVNGVSSTGTFVKNAVATWDVTGDDGIPEGWTVETVNV